MIPSSQETRQWQNVDHVGVIFDSYPALGEFMEIHQGHRSRLLNVTSTHLPFQNVVPFASVYIQNICLQLTQINTEMASDIE